jgi:acetoin utilization protein AcuB
MYVANIMSSAIIAAVPWLPAARLIELMVDENIGAVPVVDDDGTPLGVVTRADVLEEDELDVDSEATAADLMRRSPITVFPTTPISEAARLMARARVHHLLVVDGAGRLVGMVSSLDVVRWVAEVEAVHPNG